MYYSLDAVLLDQADEERLFGYVAFDKHGRVRHCPTKAGREIVDHHHRPAGVEYRQHRMAADIAPAARHEDRNFIPSFAHSRLSPKASSCSKNPSGSFQTPYDAA